MIANLRSPRSVRSGRWAARKDRGSFVRLEPAGSRDVGFTRSRGGSSRPALRESRSGVPGALAVGAPL